MELYMENKNEFINILDIYYDNSDIMEKWIEILEIL